MIHHSRSGFTVVELLVSIAVIAILAAVLAPGYGSYQIRNDQELIATQTEQALRRASALAQGMAHDGPWGVALTGGTLYIFQGTDFASRDTSLDETFDIPSTTTVSGIAEVAFEKFDGEPDTTGTITFTSDQGDIRSISINAQGRISR